MLRWLIFFNPFQNLNTVFKKSTITLYFNFSQYLAGFNLHIRFANILICFIFLLIILSIAKFNFQRYLDYFFPLNYFTTGYSIFFIFTNYFLIAYYHYLINYFTLSLPTLKMGIMPILQTFLLFILSANFKDKGV